MPDDVSIECSSGVLSLNFPLHLDFNSYDFIQAMKEEGIQLENIEWEWCG